jgi:protein TonB
MHAERLIRESTTVGAELINVAKTNEAIPPPKPPPLPELVTKKVIFIAPKVVDDSNDTGPIFTQADLNELRKNEKVSDTFVIIDNDQNDKKIIDDDKDRIVHEYSGVEEKPDFPGGVAEMNIFIAENIKYPKLASENKIQGKVMIGFIVEADGTLSNINVKKSIGAGCDEEAERVIKLMPRWTPGKQNNQPVRVEVMVPIKFTIVY